MSTDSFTYPFDANRNIGTVCEVSATFARANLPYAADTSDGFWHHGNRIGGGEVSEFVVIECGEFGIFGRLTSVKVPESERLSVETSSAKSKPPHPVGYIQLLATISLKDQKVIDGILKFPRIGSPVFSAHPLLLKWMAEAVQRPDIVNSKTLRIASLTDHSGVVIGFTPERLFGRHCAVLGATGSGKSWTLARMVEETCKYQAKVILLDATGEFHALKGRIKHRYIGPVADSATGAMEVVFPHKHLTEQDLFALYRPAGGVQVPKMRAAIKSLKLAAALPAGDPLLDRDGCMIKAAKLKAPFETAYRTHIARIDDPLADFNIDLLAKQIQHECVFPNAFGAVRGGPPDFTRWGDTSDSDFSHCHTLIARIESFRTAAELACIMQPGTKPSVADEIDAFLKDADNAVFRLSFRHLPFALNAREIVANAIGRHLLSIARLGKFLTCPLIVILDEAHQFLNKWLGDENSKYPLDSFDLIAKEGRKYCLNICLATQRPRDIPEGVLSQVGTMLVHRLTNHHDREVVERASGDIDRSAANLLPTLTPGQACIIGVDFPIPLTLQVLPPTNKPDSRGPDFQCHWESKTAPHLATSSTPPGAI